MTRKWNLVLVTSLILAPLPLLAQQPADAEKRIRQILDLKVGFEAYVFDGKDFPRCDFEKPDAAKELLGEYTIKAAVHDRNGERVSHAAQPGMYLAIVEATGAKKPALRRYFTLYRSAEKGDPSWKYSKDSAKDLAGWTKIDPAIIAAQGELIADICKSRTYSDLCKDAQFCRLLAGLSVSDPAAKKVRKNDDAFAQDRQAWVTLKRTLNGLDKFYTKPVVAPDKRDGKPAPVVHEGTLEEAGMKPDAAKNIDAVLQDWAANDDEAFAVCIVRNGVIVLHKAYGTRDGKPMTVDTKSWMASITKTMSSSCMLMLIDRGMVDLDEPVEKYLPALRDLRTEHSATIRNLYTHTAGMAKWPADWYHDEAPDIEERVALGYPFLAVGKEWAYNGQSFTLGGKIIENVSGEALPIYFRKHLLDPLGCPNTDVVGTHADAGSVPLDMAKFGQMLLNKGSYGDQRFFSEETFEKMLPHKLTKELGPDATKTFGFGLDGTPDKFGHGAASAATFNVDRAEELVVIMTRNKMGKNQNKYNGKFWDAIKNGIEKK
jgi:CubicO group peptidase (beta-lactamase class C family)